jgi:hypothetical protein
MTNAISPISSSPFAGTGTAGLQVTTAGLYTVQFKSFLPYLASGSPAQSAAATPEATNVTFAADTAGSKNNTYFTFNSAGDVKKFYVWFNINSAGTDPAVANATGIQVAGATGATAATLATAAIAAINANATAALYVVATAGASGHAIITNLQPGDATDAANGTASYGASFAITQGSYGTPAQSGLTAKIMQNSTVIASFGNPSPTQPIMGGSAVISASANDTLAVVFSSLSSADSALNAVKSIVNLYAGE